MLVKSVHHSYTTVRDHWCRSQADLSTSQKRNLKSDGINPFLLSTAIDSAPQPASSQKSLSQKMKQVALQPSKLQSSLTSDNRNRPPARQNRPAFHFAPLQRFTQPQETPFSIQIANDDVKNHTRPNLQQELTSVAGLKSFPYMLEWEDTKVSEQVLKAMDEQFGRAAHKRSKAEKRAKEEASIRPLLFDEIAMAPLDPARASSSPLLISRLTFTHRYRARLPGLFDHPARVRHRRERLDLLSRSSKDLRQPKLRKHVDSGFSRRVSRLRDCAGGGCKGEVIRSGGGERD